MLVTKSQRHGNMSVGASDVARERVDARRLFGKYGGPRTAKTLRIILYNNEQMETRVVGRK